MLSDNYGYLVSGDGRTAFVIDPSEAVPVKEAAARMGWQLVGVLCTHHHWDHVGGVEGLALPVLGEGTHAGLAVRALPVPGHTLDARAFLIGDAVFTGDTLFLAGCGRLFEGTAEQMYASLQTLAALPPETRVYCGHEYTEKNLAFARAVEPDNAFLATLGARMPGTIAEELQSNPFIRAGSVARFAELRAWKDRF